MSTMSTAVAAAMSELWDFAADLGSYIPIIGNRVDDIRIRIDKVTIEEPEDMETVVTGIEIRAKVILSDIGGKLPTGKTQNAQGDYFFVNNQNYEVTEILGQDNHFVVCAVIEAD